RRGVDAGGFEDRPHGRRGDGDAEPGEFSVDAAISPRRVLRSETEDRPTGLDRGGGPAGPMRVGPAVRDEASMPTQDRVGLHQQDRPVVTTERTRERGEDRSITWLEARTRDLASQHSELMAQHEDLDIFGTIPAAAQH